MAFKTDQDIRNRLAGLLKQEQDQVPGYWDPIVSDSNAAGYNEIVTKLVARGYSKAQVDAWDRGAEFEIDIALFWCLVKGAGLHGYDDKFINKLDRRAELDEVDVLIDGKLVDPAGVAGDQWGWGLQETSNERFSFDADDANLDTPTVW